MARCCADRSGGTWQMQAAKSRPLAGARIGREGHSAAGRDWPQHPEPFSKDLSAYPRSKSSERMRALRCDAHFVHMAGAGRSEGSCIRGVNRTPLTSLTRCGHAENRDMMQRPDLSTALTEAARPLIHIFAL